MRKRYVTLTIGLRQLAAIAVVVAMGVIAVGCDVAGDEAAGTIPSTPAQDAASSAVASTSTVAPTTVTSVTTTTLGDVSTTSLVLEPVVIHLSGSSTVYSPDGAVRVSGWVDRPASV